MSNYFIPAYKMSDLDSFCPLGEWLLLSEDGLDIIARFLGPNMLVSLPAPVGNLDETKVAA